jgi:replicative DNA helicase
MNDDLSVVQIERALLGVLHVDPSLVEQVEVGADEFFSVANAGVFRGISELYREHGRVDLHLLKDWASTNYSGPKGDLWEALGASHDAFGSTSCVEQYAVEIRNQARLRVIVDAGKDIIRNAYESRDADSALSAATDALSVVEESFGDSKRDDVSAMATAYMHEVLDVQSGKVEARFTPSGLGPLDAVIGGGFKPGWQVVVIASAGHGKSALAINNFALSSALAGKPALVCSLEMPTDQLVGRLIATLSKVPAHLHHRVGELTSYQQSDMIDAARRLGELPLVISETARDVGAIEREAKAVKRQYGDLGVVVVDYLQLMDSPRMRRDGTQEEEISANSKGLKRMAVELGCTSVILSQPNSAAKRADRLITVRDAKGSGAIEDDCDLAISPFLFHKADPGSNHPRNLCKIGMSKFRHGLETSLSETDVSWSGSSMKFEPRMEAL